MCCLIFRELFGDSTIRIIQDDKVLVISLDTDISNVIWLMPSLKSLIKLYSENHIVLKQIVFS